MIKAVIIDDEVHCLDTLGMLLADYCPEVEVLDSFVSPKKALEVLDNIKPDLVFLDIEMPVMNGFELLQHYKQIPFAVIFATGYDQYAIKAIRFSALDYLLKPVDPKELIAAVHKTQAQKQHPSNEQFNMLIHQLQHRDNSFTKIAIPTFDGFELLSVDQIIRCEADDKYTYFFLKNKSKLVACRSLKEVEEQLHGFTPFIRVHHSFIVNLNEVVKYVRGEGGYLIMSDGASVNVSRSRKDALIKRFAYE
jgi:two-component system LytT family response regulator